MRFSLSFLILSLAAITLASPFHQRVVRRSRVVRKSDTDYTIAKRALLTVRPYSEFQISDGVAGNALAEVEAKFPIGNVSLATISDSDAQILSDARETAESAETDAFNPAIDAAGYDSTLGTQLQNGKIKNKVLKLKLEVLGLQIEQAQGEDVADKLAEEQAKLDTNIALDKEAAGQVSKSVQFDG